jgi:hypothetical protein
VGALYKLFHTFLHPIISVSRTFFTTFYSASAVLEDAEIEHRALQSSNRRSQKNEIEWLMRRIFKKNFFPSVDFGFQKIFLPGCGRNRIQFFYFMTAITNLT